MSIDTSALLLWGVTYHELAADREEDELGELASDLDSASPYYDSDRPVRVFGVQVLGTDNYSFLAVPDDLSKLVEKAASEFRQRTGLGGRLYLSPQVW